jgi:hypothetical protein
MGITVIDPSPELFWFVSNALLQAEIPLKHLQSIEAGEKSILHDLPEMVILNGDDKTIATDLFINKMRNHVFARNILFIVITSNTTSEFKKSLLIAGAAQILYKGKGFGPSPKFFASLIKWFLNYKTPDIQIFDYKPSPFPSEAEFTTYGRIGWISSTHCVIESNVELSPGQSIDLFNPLFDELQMKNVKAVCVEKNKVGRYYQYANSLLCKITSKNSEKDQKTLNSWIQDNYQISKHKPVKIVYFENDTEQRDQIKLMIKFDKRYCARGFSDLTQLADILDHELPHLVLVNRALIQKDKALFEKMKNFVKEHFCYCVTYAQDNLLEIEEFKTNYPYAMHFPSAIDLPLLESMILKIENKLPDNLKTDMKKIYFSKYSAYSRVALSASCKLTEIASNGVGVELPFNISNYCACEIASNIFATAQMARSQFFRSFISKPSSVSSRGIYHRLIFVGQNLKDNKAVEQTTELITKFGYDRWIKGDTVDENKKV